MSRLPLLVFLFTAVLNVSSFAQGPETDSLLSLLDKTTSPKERIDLLNRISFNSYDYDVNKGYEYAREAFTLASANKYGRGIRQSLTLRGFYFHDIGEYKNALVLYRQASEVPIPDDDLLGYNNVMIANVYRSIARYDSARVYYEKAILLLKQLKSKRYLAYAHRNMGKLCVLEWKNEEARTHFNEALGIYDGINSNFGKAEVYFALAELSRNLAEYREAEKHITNACHIAEKLDDDYLRLHCLVYQGEVQFRTGLFTPALASLLQAVELLKRKDVPETMVKTYMYLGDVYEAMSQNAVSLRYYLEAMKVAEKLGLRYEIAMLQSHIAWIYKNQRNFSPAFDFIEKSLVIRREIGDQFGISNAYNVKGIIYLQQKKYDQAEEWLKRALAIRKQIGYKEGVAGSLYNLALVYEEQKQLEKALQFQYQSLMQEKSIGNRYNIGIGYNSVGSVYTYLHRFDSARHYLSIAENIGKETGSLFLQMENAFYWSEFFEGQGNDKEALDWHKKYASLNDSVYYEASATKLAEMQALYQTDQKDKEITLLNQEKMLQSNQIQLQDAKINLQNFIIIFAVVALILVSLLAYRTYRYNKIIRIANQEILLQKEAIKDQSMELQKAYSLIAESHRELEVKVQERTFALREAYRELDTFFYRASHDFRRPLTTFLGLVEVANITVTDPNARELFEKVRETATNLDRMLLKLQSISDLGSEQLPYGRVDLPGIFSEVLEQFQDEITENNIRMDTQVVLQNSFYSYPAMIRMIVENLVENSISFSRYQGSSISIRATQHKGRCILEVIDNGDGIDILYHDKIFEMYFRGNDRSRGNGLGLYIVRKVMEKLHGQLFFCTLPDHGTHFRLVFPIGQKEE